MGAVRWVVAVERADGTNEIVVRGETIEEVLKEAERKSIENPIASPVFDENKAMFF